jgi:DNA-binding MarR family transcriptional regulator
VAGPTTVSELARRMDMSTAHASLVVGELARAGLVEREHDDNDRRRVIVSLSDKAKPALAQLRDRHAAVLGSFLMGFDDDQEAGRFIDHLTELIACLNTDASASGGRPPTTASDETRRKRPHRRASIPPS